MNGGKSSAHPELHKGFSSQKLNRLRAGVLGANDGIVSVAGLVVGVASATSEKQIILTAALAGIIAGGVSMAAGEYVSVSSQKDSEKAQLEMEKYELKNFPGEEFDELVEIYRKKGLKLKTAHAVASELSEKDALRAHSEAELGIDRDELTSPWQASLASGIAFLAGSLVPAGFILLAPENFRIQATFIGVVIALAVTGFIGAKIGGAQPTRAILRVIVGGVAAMAVTYVLGKIFSIGGI